MNRNHHRILITEQLLDAGNSGELPCSYDGGFLTEWGHLIEPFGTMTADGLTKLLDSINREGEEWAYPRESRQAAWEAYDEWDEHNYHIHRDDPDYPSYVGCVCPYSECDDGPMCDLRRTVHQAIWVQAIRISGLSPGRSEWWYRKMVTDGELRLGDPTHPPMSNESWWHLYLGSASGEDDCEVSHDPWWSRPTLLESTRRSYRRESIDELWYAHEAQFRIKSPPPVDDWGTGLYATRTILEQS